MKQVFAFLLVFLALPLAAGERVELTQGHESVVIRIDGQVFGVFRYSSDRNKPFMLPVVAPGGMEILSSAVKDSDTDEIQRQVMVAVEEAPVTADDGRVSTLKYGEIHTVAEVQEDKLRLADAHVWVRSSDVAPLASMVVRPVNDNPSKTKDVKAPEYYDHPHHKGIWVSMDEVNGLNFWMEKEKVLTRSVEILEKGGDSAAFRVSTQWVKADGTPLVDETEVITVTPNRLLSYDITFAASGEDVAFADTKEGMFAIRLPNSMRELLAKGPVTNAEGRSGTKACWGRTSPWINYNGPIAGEMFGVMIMDDPRNPWPSRYHVRDYGLFAINPFGDRTYTANSDDKQPARDFVLKPSEPVRFRYGLWVHGANAGEEQFQGIFSQFAPHGEK